MNKKVIFGAVFLAILIAGLLFYFNNQKSGLENQESPPESEQKELNETVSVEEEINDTQPFEEKNKEIKIFNPTLTYEGFYNGPLYATSEQIGNYPIGEYMSNLNRNGVNFFIGMFGVAGEQNKDFLIVNENLGYLINAVEKYPSRIIPFFSPGYGGEEIQEKGLYGDKLTLLYSDALISIKVIAGGNFIRGLGEIETQEWTIRHNDPRILQLTDLASSNNINFMFHPVANKLDDVQSIIEKYPDTEFLIHMYREDVKNGQQKLINMMKTHDNLYFSIDAAHIMHYDGNDILYSYYDNYGKNADKNFISAVNNNYDSILDSAVKAYKPIVEAAPDKVMWGTEAGPDYAFEPEVYDLMIKISRDFISKISDDTKAQEDFGYKNALRVFGQGVVLENDVAVYDTSGWADCSVGQLDECDDSCGIVGEDDTSPEKEQCFIACIIQKKCVDKIEE